MKKLMFTVFMVGIICLSINAQSLKSGVYVTADGLNYRNISILENGTIKAGVSSMGYDIYEKIETKKYKGIKTVQQNGTEKIPTRNFYLEIVSDKSIKLYREGQMGKMLYLKDVESAEEELMECDLYKKYMKKIEEDPNNTQIWTFCAAAALQMCQAADEDIRNAIAKMMTASMKPLWQSNDCPCKDVIPQKVWDDN